MTPEVTIVLVLVAICAGSIYAAYSIVKGIWMRSLKREHRYTNWQLTAAIVGVFLLVSVPWVALAVGASAFDALGHSGAGVNIANFIANLYMSAVPIVVCILCLGPLVSANARGRMPFIAAGLLLILTAIMMDRSIWSWLMTVGEGVWLVIAMMGTPHTDEYKAAMEAEWLGETPEWKVIKDAARREARKVKVGSLICTALILAAGCTVAYSLGSAQGERVGYERGDRDGYDTGYEEGSAAGYEEGYANGEKEGRKAGYEQGKAAGSLGYSNAVPYNKGFLAGFERGAESMLKELIEDARNIEVNAYYNNSYQFEWDYDYD